MGIERDFWNRMGQATGLLGGAYKEGREHIAGHGRLKKPYEQYLLPDVKRFYQHWGAPLQLLLSVRV